MFFLLLCALCRHIVACPVTDILWYEQYTYKPCQEGDPIIVNKEHPGGSEIIYDFMDSFVNIVKYEAESYYLKCREGFGAKKTGNQGDWGYFYGGCLVVGEQGENNYELEVVARYDDKYIYAPYNPQSKYEITEGVEVEYAGFTTGCALPWYMVYKDFYDNNEDWPINPFRPPLRAHIGCWYFDDATQKVHKVEFANGVWHKGIKWGDYTVEFECGMHAIYNSTLDFPRYTWFNYKQAS